MGTLTRLGNPLAFAVVVVTVVILQLGQQFRDQEPTHFDEWRSVAWAQRMIDSGRLSAQPVVGSPDGLARDIADRNRSLAFVALVAGWIQLTGDPIAHYKGFAILFLCVYVVGLFVLAKSLGATAAGALAAGLFAATLPTNVMILGPRLGVPSSASMGLLCFALAAHHRLANRAIGTPFRLWTTLLIGSAGVLALIYPVSLIVFVAIAMCDTLANLSNRSVQYTRVLAISSVVLVLALLVNEWQRDGSSTTQHVLQLLVVEQRWHLIRALYLPLLTLVPVALLALAVPSAIYCATVDRSRWVALLILGPIVSYVAYETIGVSLVVPYQRLGLYLGLGCCLCAGLSIGWLFEWLEGKERSGLLAWCISGSAAVFVVVLPSSELELPIDSHRPPDDLRDALGWIAGEYEPPTSILTWPPWSMYVEPLTGLRAAPEGIDAHLIGRPTTADLNCDGPFTIIVESTSYVRKMKGRTRCSDFQVVGRWGNVWVYERQGEVPALPEESAVNPRLPSSTP